LLVVDAEKAEHGLIHRTIEVILPDVTAGFRFPLIDRARELNDALPLVVHASRIFFG
jgi:hypothetical protein